MDENETFLDTLKKRIADVVRRSACGDYRSVPLIEYLWSYKGEPCDLFGGDPHGGLRNFLDGWWFLYKKGQFTPQTEIDELKKLSKEDVLDLSDYVHNIGGYDTALLQYEFEEGFLPQGGPEAYEAHKNYCSNRWVTRRRMRRLLYKLASLIDQSNTIWLPQDLTDYADMLRLTCFELNELCLPGDGVLFLASTISDEHIEDPRSAKVFVNVTDAGLEPGLYSRELLVRELKRTRRRK